MHGIAAGRFYSSLQFAVTLNFPGIMHERRNGSPQMDSWKFSQIGTNSQEMIFVERATLSLPDILRLIDDVHSIAQILIDQSANSRMSHSVVSHCRVAA